MAGHVCDFAFARLSFSSIISERKERLLGVYGSGHENLLLQLDLYSTPDYEESLFPSNGSLKIYANERETVDQNRRPLGNVKRVLRALVCRNYHFNFIYLISKVSAQNTKGKGKTSMNWNKMSVLKTKIREKETATPGKVCQVRGYSE